MNDIEKVLNKEEQVEIFQFGVFTLHAWKRFLERLLHISYRLEQKW